MELNSEQHNVEIHENLKFWNSKRLLRYIYKDFYLEINSNIDRTISGKIVELGSGIGKIKAVIPDCLTTDVFPNEWIDNVESIYNLSFKNNSISNFILFDVFHHIEYPGDALNELHRALNKKGKIILFEPSLSLLGRIVYGLFHHEPIGIKNKIKWNKGTSNHFSNYYAAQGNAYRLFYKKKYSCLYEDKWKVHSIKRSAAFSYVLSGGYRGTQLYPEKWYHFMKKIDVVFDLLPALFATRLLIVLEKR